MDRRIGAALAVGMIGVIVGVIGIVMAKDAKDANKDTRAQLERQIRFNAAKTDIRITHLAAKVKNGD